MTLFRGALQPVEVFTAGKAINLHVPNGFEFDKMVGTDLRCGRELVGKDSFLIRSEQIRPVGVGVSPIRGRGREHLHGKPWAVVLIELLLDGGKEGRCDLPKLLSEDRVKLFCLRLRAF